MAPLATHVATLSTIIILFAAIAISGPFRAQRIPLGGSVFSIDSARLSERQSNDLGTDCGGDPNCTTADFGCGCGFLDGSWMDDPSITGGATGITSTTSTSVVASSTVPVTSTLSSSSTSQPAPVITTSSPSPPSPAVSCVVVDVFDCNCSDGSHPEQDEDGRCCLNNPPPETGEQCWDASGPVLEVRAAPTTKQYSHKIVHVHG